MLRDDWLLPLPTKRQAVLLHAHVPCGETSPPVGRRSQGGGLPASTVEGSPALLTRKSSSLRKKSQVACGAERVNRGLSGFVANGEPLLRAEKLNASNVSR